MIENERKYLLSCGEEEGNILRDIKKLPHKHLRIEQGYLDGNSRLRKTIHEDIPSYHFTYKRRLNGEQIEIETPITEEDFIKLWRVTDSLILKDRYVLDHKGYTWEFDFFYGNFPSRKNCYLIMAEVELPLGEDIPKETHPLIGKYHAILIQKHDKRFDNHTLSQPIAIRRIRNVYKIKENHRK